MTPRVIHAVLLDTARWLNTAVVSAQQFSDTLARVHALTSHPTRLRGPDLQLIFDQIHPHRILVESNADLVLLRPMDNIDSR
jgi:hypothetical protein